MTELLSLDAFRAALRTGVEPPHGPGAHPVVRVSVDPPELLDDASRKFRFTFSDGSVDRMGDTIAADGWDWSSFAKNPVALWAHDASSPPIGRASNVHIAGGKLKGDIEFAPAEDYPFAETIYRLVKGGFINAVSVGFMPVEYSFAKDKERPFGIDFERQELLEISVVPVPANANALIEARAKGILLSPLVEWATTVLAQVGARGSDGMSESDPSAGGFVANCGRKAEEECGLKNPEECAVHGPGLITQDEDKKIIALIQRAVRAELRAAGIKAGKPADDEPDGDEPDANDPDAHTKHIVHVKAAHFHAKECMRSLKKALDLVDVGDEDPAGNPEGERAADAVERAQRLERLAELAAAD
jgi:HK97 family phage prohead protease